MSFSSTTSSPPASSIHSDSDGSYVLLPPRQVKTLKSSVSEPSSIQTSLGLENASEEELVAKIQFLKTENEDLKEVLQKNNNVLQEYFEELGEIRQKQQERTKTFVTGHNQAKNLVRKLREKNSNLKNELRDEREKVADLEKQLAIREASADVDGKEVILKDEWKQVQAENSHLKEENSTLLHNIHLLQDQINFLKTTVKETNGIDTNSEARKAVESLSALSDDVGNSLLSKQPQEPLSIGSLEDKCRKSAIDKEILKVDFDKLKIEKAQVDEQLEEVKVENEKLLKGNKHLRNEKEELCRMLSEVKAKEIETVDTEIKLPEALAEKMEHEQTAKSLLQQLEDERDKLFEANKRNIECQQTIDAYEAQLEYVQGQNEEGRVALAEARGKVEECNEKIREMERELEQGKKAAEEVFGFDDENIVVKEKIDALKKQLWRYEQRENKLHDKEEDLAKKEADMNRVYQENDQLNLQLQESESKMANLRQANVDLQHQLGEKQHEVEDLSQQLSELSRQNQVNLQLQESEGKMANLRKANVDLQYQLGEKQQQIEDLSQQLSELTGLQSHQEDTLRGQVVQLIDDNRAYEQKFHQVEEELREQRKQADGLIESLRTHLAGTEAELKTVKNQRDTHSKEHEGLLAQNEQLMTEYDDLLKSFKNTIDGNKKKQDSSQTELVGIKARLESMNAELTKAQQAAQKKHEDCAALERRVRELQVQNESIPVLETQIEVYQNDFNAERQAREQQHSEILSLRQQLNRLHTDNQRVQDELDAYNNTQMAEMQRRHGNQGYVTMGAGQGSPSPTGAAYQGGQHGNLIENMTGATGTFLRRGSTPGSPEGLASPPITPQNQMPIGGTQGAQNAGNEGDDDWPCPTCRQKFPNFETLQVHAVECNAVPPELMPPEDNGQPQCPKCLNFFPDLDTLQIHVMECIDFN